LLGVESAGRLLEVREAGSVLDMKERSAPEIPGDEVRATRELIVLIRLVDSDSVAEPAQLRRLHLSHRRVDDVDGKVRARRRASVVDDIESKVPVERYRKPRRSLHRGGFACLDPVDHVARDAGSNGELRDGPAAIQTSIAHLVAEQDRNATKLRPHARADCGPLAWRHSKPIQRGSPYSRLTSEAWGS
jgi:hypothetical protein